MTHDSDNPFQKLSQVFAAKGKDASAHAAPHVKQSPNNQKQNSAMAHALGGGDSDDDARLFMQAMQYIPPLPKKKKNPHKDTRLATALAAGGSGESGLELSASASANISADTSVQNKHGSPSAQNINKKLDLPHENAADVQSSEETLFSKAMSGVTPVSTKGRQIATPAKKKNTAPSVDPAKALQDILDGRMEFSLNHSDEYMEGHIVGFDPLLLGRLREGQLSPEGHLDLHGQTAAQALDSLSWFIKHAYQRSMRMVIIVTGRGKNSPDGVGVLRPLLQEWLCRAPFKRVVLAFCTAKAKDGGPGAVYVLLRKYKKSNGKIIWEHAHFDTDAADY